MSDSPILKYKAWLDSLTAEQKEEWEAWIGFSFRTGVHYPRAWEIYMPDHDSFEGYHLLMHSDRDRDDCERCNRFRDVLREHNLWPKDGEEHLSVVRKGGSALFREGTRPLTFDQAVKIIEDNV